jgi:uncharacterized protein (DUF2384 family)
MKKKSPSSKSKSGQQAALKNEINEPQAFYGMVAGIPHLQDFSWQDFKKIADRSPFSLSEWAAMLHVSERTLQRYAKNNGNFASINAERALQLDGLLTKGRAVFGSVSRFYEWLQSQPPAPEGQLGVVLLSSAAGINLIMAQLGRLEHGVLA